VSIAITAPDPTCIAGFYIELYVGKAGSTDMSGSFVSCKRRMSALCRFAYVAKLACFSFPLVPLVFV
jgi:hypothetical protein